jgi:amidase
MWHRTATDLAAAIRAREVTPREVVAAHLERIEELNPQVNAIVTQLEPEQALAAADAAPPGPLQGLPIAVKDLEDTAGMRTTYGSRLFADHVPTQDSLLVERLRRAGAVIIGKTNTPEFGAGSQTFNAVFGATRNPHDLSRTPGGSSGGAAAAVAAHMIPFADGSDHGASVRNPAAFCGLYGLRPTPGRIPDHGAGDPYDPFPVLGALARTPQDVALLFSALAGPDPRDPLSIQEPWPLPATLECDPSTLRIAWSDTLGGLPVEPEVTAVLHRARARLEALGCTVVEDEPDLSGADECFEVLRGAKFAAAFAHIADDVKPTLRTNIRFGQNLDAARIGRALAHRGELFTRMREFLTRYDMLAAPVTQLPPFSVELEYPTEIAGQTLHSYLEWFRSCSRITTTGHPALAVPAGTTADGLPIGLQLVGRHRGELALLALAEAMR